MQNLGPFFFNPSPTTQFLQEGDGADTISVPCNVNLSGNMSEANVVYSDVKFIKTKEKATGESFLNMFISL